jgi:hypothetical protein
VAGVGAGKGNVQSAKSAEGNECSDKVASKVFKDRATTEPKVLGSKP